ncbi:putative manganese-dependent inorganic diphosphatase [Fuchsiella alkaliacetigena]|uniref:putative manganese-dependent inorganic diphosphatase n=1 Tax=Fuchsiella alkaliacetigena TaxID=957042 RepID=UPI00200A4523|nr:putative manganese-dependent inorganic diphosphatase [Fuchsiella alkaliacetigena]MCK8825754.1 putative manganese-dependent inorganic diphosphatase [Fuchsiella alkaliacetigena]
MKNKEKIIIGHQNPDTDSICSTIAYAEFKEKNGEKAIAARCGKLNPETKFVLDYFGVPTPKLISDVYPRVKDTMQQDNLKVVSPDTPLKEVGEILKTEQVKLVSIVNQEKKLLGIITAADLAYNYLEELNINSMRKIPTSLKNIVKTLAGELINKQQNLDSELNGRVFTGAMATETMANYIKAGDIGLLGNRPAAQKAALEAGASCLIITGNLEINKEIEDLAIQKKATLIKVPYDTFTAAKLIGMSIPISQVMRSEVKSFYPEELIADIKEEIIHFKHRTYPVINHQNKLLGLISAQNLINLQRKELILVDHNEKSQAVEGIEAANIIEIIDHHRLGDLETLEPILVRNQPVGSTATIIAKLYLQSSIELNKKIAGLLLAAILSDTVIFRSPTCTELDKKIANKLAQKTDLDSQEFGKEIFKAGSVVNKLEPKEMILNDFKEYAFDSQKIGVGQIEVMDLAEFKKHQPKTLTALHELKEEENYQHLFLMVTDILNEGSLLLFDKAATNLVTAAFTAPQNETSIYLADTMSRKKQVIPSLSTSLIKE